MTKPTFLLMLVGCLLLGTAAQGAQVTVIYRDGGGSAGYSNLAMDMTDISLGADANSASPRATSFHVFVGPYRPSDGQEADMGLLGIKDLLTELPLPSASKIVSATLTIYSYQGKEGNQVKATRVLTDWIPNAAGSNAEDTAGNYRALAAGWPWAAGTFSDADHDTANGVTVTYGQNVYAQPQVFDVTNQVKAMYTAGVHYGWALVSAESGMTMYNNNAELSRRPTLQIVYEDDGNTFTLTVDNGTGDGTYSAGTSVAIVADAASTAGWDFDSWAGDTAGIEDTISASTNLMMPYQNATVTATYSLLYTLTVNSGTGGGSYIAGRTIDIEAGTAPSGQIFQEWIGDTSYLDNDDTTSATTTLTMPAANAEITALYTDAPSWTLTVNSGYADGNTGTNVYTFTQGQTVSLQADAAPSGMWFDQWYGQIRGVADLDTATTTFTVPTGDSEITATYSRGTRIKFREGVGTGFTYVDFDDVYVHGPGDPTAVNENDVGCISILKEGNSYPDATRTGLVAVKDMFTQLPATSGGYVLRVNKAKLLMYWNLGGENPHNPGSSRDWGIGVENVVHFFPVVTNWLLDTAGSNEDDVNGYYAQASTSTPWAAGAGNTITTADWNTDQEAQGRAFGHRTGGITPAPDSGLDMDDRDTFEITLPIQWMYNTSTNYGVTFWSHDDDNPDDGWSWICWNPSEVGDPDLRPVLVIDYDYAQPYTLTVNSGSGDGSYGEGVVVPIEADDVFGYDFVEWVGDTEGCADVNAASTNYTMPGQNAEITATYSERPTYTLTVNSGTGSGDYWENTVVDIAADAAPTDYIFDDWEGDTDYVADPDLASTTVTMPAQAVTVTATYIYMPYTLTVNSGYGDGNYLDGMVVKIAADVAAVGKVFDAWVGDTGGIADVNRDATTLTMPTSNQEVTATYTDDVVQGTRIKFRDSVTTGYVQVDIDDTYINFKDEFDDSNYGTEKYIQIIDGTSNNDNTHYQRAGLFGIKELFTELPGTTNGGTIRINKAMLYFQAIYVTQGTPFYFARVTTDWLIDAAGTPQNMVTGTYARFDTDFWADYVSFSDDDYDGTGKVLAATMGSAQYYDVTPVIADIYSSGDNYGLAMIPEADHSSSDPAYRGIWLRSSEQTTAYRRPVLQIDYDYIYTLTVNSGTGDGQYASGEIANIVADAPASGKEFDAWIGDVGGVADVNAASTTLTMPAANQEVTATYTDIPAGFTLTVNSGTGDGQYAGGTIVSIAADAPPTNELDFREWVGDTGGIADVYEESTTLTMPSADQEVTATYRLTGDLNRDGFVGQTDLDYVLDDWGEYTPPAGSANPWADQSDDGFVGQTDLDYVLDDWGQSYP